MGLKKQKIRPEEPQTPLPGMYVHRDEGFPREAQRIFFLFGSHRCSGFLSEAEESTMSNVKTTLKTGTNTPETLEKMNGIAIVI